MILVSLDDAKRHLTITDPAQDAEVQMYLEQASATIVDYLAAHAVPTWTPDTAPPVVKKETLRYLAHLYEHRGDTAAEDDGSHIWNEIARGLARLRDPSLA